MKFNMYVCVCVCVCVSIYIYCHIISVKRFPVAGGTEIPPALNEIFCIFFAKNHFLIKKIRLGSSQWA